MTRSTIRVAVECVGCKSRKVSQSHGGHLFGARFMSPRKCKCGDDRREVVRLVSTLTFEVVRSPLPPPEGGSRTP